MIYEVILDGGETANKCTIAPLADRPDFRLIPTRGGVELGPLRSPVLLHPEGACLTAWTGTGAPPDGIAAIDCVWSRVPTLLGRIQGRLPALYKIPEGFVTAYPRTNKQGADPDRGLATIEAIFLAAALLGRWDPTLLSRYAFCRRFLERISRPLQQCGYHNSLAVTP
jgi:pre-rRNA-processing protein TSR3